MEINTYSQHTHRVQCPHIKPNSIHNIADGKACARSLERPTKVYQMPMFAWVDGHSAKEGKLINKLEWHWHRHRHFSASTVDFQFVYDFDACVRKYNELVVQTMSIEHAAAAAVITSNSTVCEINGNPHIDCVVTILCSPLPSTNNNNDIYVFTEFASLKWKKGTVLFCRYHLTLVFGAITFSNYNYSIFSSFACVLECISSHDSEIIRQT